MHIEIITVPYRYDEYKDGLGAGPDALLNAGIIDRLSALGADVSGPTEATLPEEEREPGRTAVNIGRLGAHTATLVATARRAGRGVLVLAGDDTASVGTVSGLQQADGAGAALGIVWLDAHGDFNTPETSYSGILAGMPLAILAGLAGPLWRGAAGLAAPIPTDRILLAGVRELDDQEEGLLRSTSATILTASQMVDSGAVARAVTRLTDACGLLFLHVDLDVLDPHLVPSASTPSRHGLEIDQVAEAMSLVLATGKVAALSLAGLNPGGGDRGRRSIATTLTLLERALPAWWES